MLLEGACPRAVTFLAWPRWRQLRWEERACETVAGWIRVPRSHSGAIDELERPRTKGSDTVEEGLPAIEKVVDVDYTHHCALPLSQFRVDQD